jgi:hypothetical protein
MKKSRRGSALVLALAVAFVGGGVIAITFDITSRYFRVSQLEQAQYVHHTSVLDLTQGVKGSIFRTNVSNDVMAHAEGRLEDHYEHYALSGDDWSVPSGLDKLKLNDLIIRQTDVEVKSGLGEQRAEVTVFDMYFHPSWIHEDELNDEDRMKEFPPVINISESSLADMISQGSSSNPTVTPPPPDENMRRYLDPRIYGAYLVRIRLFGNDGRLVRTVEEAFVQLLDRNTGP